MRAWPSRSACMTLTSVVVGLALVCVPGRAAADPNDPHVEEKEKEVKRGDKGLNPDTPKIDWESDDEIEKKESEKVEEMSPQKEKITSRPLNPPKPTEKWDFERFRSWYHFIEIVVGEEQGSGIIKETKKEIKFWGTTSKDSADMWPVKAEGNVKPKGSGGNPSEWHWSATIGRAAVDIKEDSISQGKEWWPENNKLLVSATHPVVADGTPSSDAHFVWKYDDSHEDWFEHNDTEKNFPEATPERHRAVFTAPSEATGAKEKDQHNVSVQYNLFNKPVDKEPLNITKPTNVGQPTVIPAEMTHPYTINSSAQHFHPWPEHNFQYPILDQFDENINTSDWGDGDGKRILMRREDVDFQADAKFAGVAQHINTHIIKEPNWKEHRDAEGRVLKVLYDKTVLMNIPTSTLGDPPPSEVKIGDRVFYVHPAHKWQLAVQGAGGNPVPSNPPHVTENEWVAEATEDKERTGNVLIFEAKTMYTVHLPHNP